MKTKYTIIASDAAQARRFAQNNMMSLWDWQYSSRVSDIKSAEIIIVLNGWGKKKCIIQRTAIKGMLALNQSKIRYMAETERLS